MYKAVCLALSAILKYKTKFTAQIAAIIKSADMLLVFVRVAENVFGVMAFVANSDV